MAQEFIEALISSGYVKKGLLTEKYYADKLIHNNQNPDFPTIG